MSSSSSKKANDIIMGRKKTTAIGANTSRQEHSNKSKLSNPDVRKKIASASSKKETTSTLQPKEKKEKESGFKNIKKKVIGAPTTVNDKENGKQNAHSKKDLTSSVTSKPATLKPKGLNSTTPRTNNSSVFSGKSIYQKTEGDEKAKDKPRSVNKS